MIYNPAGANPIYSTTRSNYTIGDYNGATGIGAGEPFNVQLAFKVIF